MKEQDINYQLKKNALYQKMIMHLAPLYFPASFEEDSLKELASEEFCRVRKVICILNNFNEEKYIDENSGTSPFDAIRDEIEQEVHNRIRKDPNYLSLLNIREHYIRMIRGAVEKENNILGTFYQNRGKHFQHDENSPEYENSPVVVIQNPEYFSYGGYEANSVYELFIDTRGKLLCTLNGESGEDFNEPIENVQTEGLVTIAHWLAEQNFISSQAFAQKIRQS